MEITDCDISGLKINGILIEDLIKKQKSLTEKNEQKVEIVDEKK